MTNVRDRGGLLAIALHALVKMPMSQDISRSTSFEIPILSSAPFPCTIRGHDSRVRSAYCALGQSLMNFERTILVRHWPTTDSDITIGSTIEELGPYSFWNISITTLTFSESSRLPVIGARALASCQRLVLVVIPSTVEVIGPGAFSGCPSLQEVRFGSGSRLRLIEEEAFSDCPYLGPIDVPLGARIEGEFSVIAQVCDADGAEHRRVRFIEPLMYL
jgi:hypothetical protein